MNILGIGCHPDDLEIACGGTLARYVKQGHKVFMCHIANGNNGHVIIQPGELSKIRRAEAQRAAAVIGAESLTLDVDDQTVEAGNKEVRNKLVEIVRYTKADVIITQNPRDYMRDHEQASQLAEDISWCCTVPHLIAGSEAHSVFPVIFYMEPLAGIGFIPTEYVDITEEMEQKLEAIACHDSQLSWMKDNTHIDFLDFVKTGNKYRGAQAGVPFAEGFRQYAAWPHFRTQRMLP